MKKTINDCYLSLFKLQLSFFNEEVYQSTLAIDSQSFLKKFQDIDQIISIFDEQFTKSLVDMQKLTNLKVSNRVLDDESIVIEDISKFILLDEAGSIKKEYLNQKAIFFDDKQTLFGIAIDFIESCAFIDSKKNV
jgi:uncharacterized protein YfbU (UPF0304 family)